MQPLPRELARSTLGVLSILALIVAAFWILRPFMAATIWATMIVVATWPMLRWLETRLWRRRTLAVLVMTLLLLLLLIVPLLLAVGTLVQYSDALMSGVKSLTVFKVPHPPAWLGNLPVVGDKALELWAEVTQAGTSGLLARLMPYADDIVKWFVTEAGSLGSVFVQFMLTVVLAAVMYSGGEAAALMVRRFGHRLAGDYGDRAVTLGGQAIRGVALGVGVTAVVQAGLGGIGLAIAGVPFAGLLTALMLLLCIAQVGVGPVMLVATGWLYWSDQSGWGTFLLVWSVVVMMLDNFLRPMLIKRGADLPLLLIFAGVIGGLLSFGLVGIFVGPVVLAVAYTLLEAWIDDGEAGSTTAD